MANKKVELDGPVIHMSWVITALSPLLVQSRNPPVGLDISGYPSSVVETLYRILKTQLQSPSSMHWTSPDAGRVQL